MNQEVQQTMKAKYLEQNKEAALQRYLQEEVLWRYTAYLQENTHAEVRFQYSCFAALLKSHFGIGVLL